MQQRLITVLLIVIAVILLGCGGGSDDTPPVDNPPQTPDPGSNPPGSNPPGSNPPITSPQPSPMMTQPNEIFESGPVRTVALTPDGTKVLVTNIANHTLEVFDVTPAGVNLLASVPVGLEPVAVAAPNNNEVWVVNHLSDSVSIVTLNGTPRVVRTLLTGDEPRDIVFAGSSNSKAFITAAYRGQHHPTFKVSDLGKSGLGRADVWVFNRTNLGADLGGTPETIINLFADTPRALAVTADQSTVYAAAFASGNQTTTIGINVFNPVVADGKALPTTNIEGIEQPDTGLIVKYRASDNTWRDDAGKDWTPFVNLQLPDRDVFTINANTTPATLTNSVSGVGTTLFNMAVNPVNGKVYVSNTEARNIVRFEGPGEQLGATTVRGHAVESRISVIDGTKVTPRHLNDHIDRSIHEGESLPPGEKEKSLAQPRDMVVTSDGKTLYVVAMGSNKVARFATAEIEQGSFESDAADHLLLAGSGAAGLALSPDDRRLYVYGRFDNSVRVIDTTSFSELAKVELFSPEPNNIKRGRQIFYDANISSATGDQSCASCHVDGDKDALAWDLGDPDGVLEKNVNEFVQGISITNEFFHPMKGPMTTQTFRGMVDSGPMHWRGDRTGANRVIVNGKLESLEAAAFKEFNPAFVGLLGKESELSTEDMQAFTDFALSIMPPPNPIRNLDNSLTSDQAEGRRVFMNERTTGDPVNVDNRLTCDSCHELNPVEKHFGTAGKMNNEIVAIEDMKVPHLRDVYTKVGMFSSSDNQNSNEQIRGFGFLHDGAVPSLNNFFQGLFTFDSDKQRQQIIDFVFAFDANYAPIVGQQVTLTGEDSGDVIARRDLLVARAQVGECDLIAKGVVEGQQMGVLMQMDGGFIRDNGSSLSLTDLSNIASNGGQELTFTCVSPGFGQRMGIDQDLDGTLNANE